MQFWKSGQKFSKEKWRWRCSRKLHFPAKRKCSGGGRRNLEKWTFDQKILTGKSILIFGQKFSDEKFNSSYTSFPPENRKLVYQVDFTSSENFDRKINFGKLGRNFLRKSSILPILHFRRKIQNLQISKFHHSFFPPLPIHFAHLPLSFGSLSTTLRLNNNISKIHSPRLFTLANTFALHYCILPAQKEVSLQTPSQNAIFTNPSTTSLSCTHFVHIFTNSMHLSKLAETPSLH